MGEGSVVAVLSCVGEGVSVGEGVPVGDEDEAASYAGVSSGVGVLPGGGGRMMGGEDDSGRLEEDGGRLENGRHGEAREGARRGEKLDLVDERVARCSSNVAPRKGRTARRRAVWGDIEL